MKTKLGLLTLILTFWGVYSFAQDEDEARTHFTGYVNAIGEYSDCIHQKKDYAFGLSELGFLGTYKLNNKIEFKSTLVYTHFTFDIGQLFVEGYGQYKFNESFKLTAGRFLTPLSPVNLYFYAPLNPSGVTPMLVSHHFLFPQSIDGFQFLGEFDLSNSTKFGYNLSLGNYAYINHMESGILGIQAQEDTYPTWGYYNTKYDLLNYYLCGTGRIYTIFNNIFTLGANYFTADAQQFVRDVVNNKDLYYPSTKYTYGFDIHLNVSKFKLNAEYWAGKQETTDETDKELGYHIENDYEAYYGEAIYDGDMLKPFVRYDFIKDVTANGVGLPTKAATIGLAFRPRFETLLKLEYKRIMSRNITDETNQIYENYNYNYAQFSFVLSF